MFLKIYHYIFILTLILGTTVAISSNSWFTSWVGLEINLIRIIPLILLRLKKPLTEAAIKYFIVQAIASLMLILSTIIRFSQIKSVTLEINEALIILALTIKAGIAPIQVWFPQVIRLLEWPQCFIMFRWQKIAPLLLISNLNVNLLIIVISLSALAGALGGLNQINIKTLLTYSSISHSSWILTSLLLRIKTWIIYFLIYTVLNIRIIKTLNENQLINKLNELNKWKTESIEKYLFIINILRLGGLPPLLGFTGKLIVVILLIKRSFYYLIIFLITRSLISIYFYLRIVYSAIIIKSSLFFKISYYSQYNNKIWNTSSILLNVLTPAMIITF